MNIDLFSYLYPKSIDQLDTFESIEQRFQARIITFSSLTILFFITVVIIISAFSIGLFSGANLILLIFIPFVILSLYRFATSGSTNLYNFTFIFFTYAVATQRTFVLQSHAWALIPWILVLFTLNVYTIGFRVAALGIVFNMFGIIYNTYYGDFFGGILPPAVQFFTNFLIPTAAFCSIIFYKSIVEAEKANEIKKCQRRDSISKMIITLSHEINNPLTIAKLCVNKLKRGYHQKSIQKLDTNLDRITKITHFIKNINDLDEVNYGNDSMMYNFYSKVSEIDDTSTQAKHE